MADYFDLNRSYFHSFGRAFTAKGQDFVDQAPLKAGHNLDLNGIRAQELPFITSEYTLGEAFTTADGTILPAGTSVFADPSAAAGSRVVRAQLSGILKFYDNYVLTVKTATNNETYQVIDSGNVIQGFVDPTDKFSSDGTSTADGYTMSLLDQNGVKQPSKAGQIWTFDPFNGTVQFKSGSDGASKYAGKTIKLIAFAYVGKYLKKEIEDIKGSGSSSISGLSELSGKFNSFTTGLTSLDAIKLSGDLSGKTFYLGLAPSSALAQSADGLKTTLTMKKLASPSSTEYAASYQLQDVEGNIFGDTIDIVKDQFLKDAKFIESASATDVAEAAAAGYTITLGKPFIKFTFTVSTGSEKKVFIDMSKLVDIYTGVSGVVVNGYKISGQIDGSSDGFFTLGADGFKVAGVSAAIDAAEDAAKAYTDVASGYTINTGSFADHVITLTRKNSEDTITINGVAASGEVISGVTGVTAEHQIIIKNIKGDIFSASNVAKYSEVITAGTFANHTITLKNSESTELFTVGGIAASSEILSGGTFDRATGTLTLNAKDSANSFDITGLIKESDISALASGKMDKLPEGFTTDNFVTVGVSGNVKDSGYTFNGSAALTDSATIIPSQGVVSSFVVGKINELDLTEVYTAGKPIVKISQTDGKVAAEVGTITADNVTYKTVTVSAQLDTLTDALFNYTASGAINTKFTAVDQAIADEISARKGADDVICGAVSGAWSSSEIVIGKANGITKSGYTLNGSAALTESTTIIPSQKVVKDYVDKASGDASKGLAALSSALTGYLGVSAVTTKFAAVDQATADETQARKDADSYISGAINGFNSTNTVSAAIKAVADKVDGLDYNLPTETGKFVNHIEQVDGKISGTLAEVTSDVVKYGASSNVSAEIAKIEGADTVDGSIAKAVKTEADRAKGVENFISGVLKDFTAEGSVSAAIEAVSQAAISVSGVAENAVTVTANGTNRQIKLNISNNDKFLSQSADGLSATISLQKLQSGIASGNASEYILVDKDGNQVGDKIEIAKDQFLSGVVLVEDPEEPGNFYLRFTFKLANDNPKTIDVPLSGMFHEYVAGNGISIAPSGNGFAISGVVDKAADNQFLTLGTNGFKVSGVSNAISTASGYIINTGSFGSNAVTLTRKNGQDAVTINGIAASGEIVNAGSIANNAITLTKKDASTVVINGVAQSGEIISGGTFDRSTGTLTLTEKNDTKINITGLIKESDISALASGKMDKLAAANVDEIVIVSGDGNAKNSGFKLGTDTDVLTGGTIAESTVATEKAVKTALGNLKDYADTTFMNEMAAAASGEIIVGGSTADTVQGSGFKLGTDTDVLTGTVVANTVATEQAVKAYVESLLTWESLS